MYLFGQDKAKVGIVTVVKRQGSYKLRFQYPLRDWVANISDPQAHQRAIRVYLDSLLSNQQKKRNRKSQ